MEAAVDHYRRALAAPNGPGYAAKYGQRAAHAAEQCRLAAIAGDSRKLLINSIALSLLTQ